MNLRNTTRKYLFLTLLSGTAICGCSDKKENLLSSPGSQVRDFKTQVRELKIQKRELEEKYFGSQEKEKNLESKTRMCYYLLSKAENSFKRFILDGYISRSEQRNILCDLAIAESLEKEIAKFTNTPPFQTSDTLKMVYPSLTKNQRGYDFGIPELEKMLNQNGYNIKVEKCISAKEIFTSFYILIGALIIKSLYITRKGGKKKGKGLFDYPTN